MGDKSKRKERGIAVFPSPPAFFSEESLCVARAARLMNEDVYRFAPRALFLPDTLRADREREERLYVPARVRGDQVYDGGKQ